MRGSLFVLNVRLLRPVDATVGKFLVKDVLAASSSTARASPVPVHSSDKLKTSNLLISQVSYDLEHFTTITIKTEDLKVHEARSVDSVLKEKGGTGHCSEKPLGVLDVVPNVSLHFINYYR